MSRKIKDKEIKADEPEKNDDKTLKDVLEGMSELTTGMCEVITTVKDLSVRVGEIEETMIKPDSPDASTNADDAERTYPPLAEPKIEEQSTTEVKPDNSYPIPSDYRIIVDETLNRKFGIEVNASPSLPTFDVTILVPDEYSNIPLEDKKTIREDRRTKVITYAEGVEGVKLWAKRVYDNFSNETKAQITQDRMSKL